MWVSAVSMAFCGKLLVNVSANSAPSAGVAKKMGAMALGIRCSFGAEGTIWEASKFRTERKHPALCKQPKWIAMTN